MSMVEVQQHGEEVHRMGIDNAISNESDDDDE